MKHLGAVWKDWQAGPDMKTHSLKWGLDFVGGGGRKGRPHALSFSISRLFVTLSHFLSLSLLLPAAAS